MKYYFSLTIALCLGICFATSLQAEVITFDATIKSVDTKTRTITVERKGKTRNLDVSRKAKITINGEKSDFDALKEGQKISLSYHTDLEIVLKIEADSTNPTDGDLGLLSGEWLTITEETNGNTFSKERVKTTNRRLFINNNRFKMVRVINGKLGQYEGMIELIPNVKPKEFNFIGKGTGGNLVEWKGIYKIDKSSLKLSYRYVRSPNTKRPQTFKSSRPEVEGEAFVVITCKRDSN